MRLLYRLFAIDVLTRLIGVLLKLTYYLQCLTLILKSKLVFSGVLSSLPWARPGVPPTSVAPRPPVKGLYKKLDL